MMIGSTRTFSTSENGNRKISSFPRQEFPTTTFLLRYYIHACTYVYTYVMLTYDNIFFGTIIKVEVIICIYFL